MKKSGKLAVVVLCAAALGAGAEGLDRRAIERKAFEALAEVAVKLPPELRMTDISAYSTNRLSFALNNGLAMTKGGRIWASWIAGGDGYKSFTVANWSDDGGETWSDVKLVIDGHNKFVVTSRTNIIGTFWLDPDGVFHLYTDQTVMHFDGRAGVWESVCHNPDAEKPEWSAPRRIADGHLLNKPIVLKDGSWAMSVYLNDTWRGQGSFPGAFPELDPLRGMTCFVSTDHGKTWERRGTVKIAEKGLGNIGDWQESQLLEADGALHVFARAMDGSAPRFMTAQSTDGGRTWSKAVPHPFLKHTNARFQMVKLASGNVVFVKHGRPDEATVPWQNGRGRVRMTAYLSEDGGKTWKGGLEIWKGKGSYPDLFQAPDGYIYVSHDHERANDAEVILHRFNEADILAGKIVSPKGKLNRLVSRGMASAFNRDRFGAQK